MDTIWATAWLMHMPFWLGLAIWILRAVVDDGSPF